MPMKEPTSDTEGRYGDCAARTKSILMMTSGFLLATRSFLVSSCPRFDLEHETREEEERSMIRESEYVEFTSSAAQSLPEQLV
ncbi:hypothetical protein ACFX13_016475 [Malus domestica]